MNEGKAMAIAEGSNLVLNGYAVTLDGGNFRVVNLKTGKAAYIMSSGELSETNMDEVESEIAIRIVSENRKYILAHFGFTISIKRNAANDDRPKSGPKSIRERIIAALVDNELSSAELVNAIGQSSLSGKLKLAIKAMLADGLIEYTVPNKPRSRLQKYRLTEKGRTFLRD